ncbi:MAG: hypothetical protein GY850_10565 [bacterium]|nr:hypothetical protein [bacterium]
MLQGRYPSYFEWLQNKRNEFWQLEEVDKKLHRFILSAYERVRDAAKELRQIRWKNGDNYE